MAASFPRCKATGSDRLPDETETGSKGLYVVYGSYATSLTHYLSLSCFTILYFCYGHSPFLCTILPSILPSCLLYFNLSSILNISFSSFHSSSLSFNTTSPPSPLFVLHPRPLHLCSPSCLFFPSSLPFSLPLSLFRQA